MLHNKSLLDLISLKTNFLHDGSRHAPLPDSKKASLQSPASGEISTFETFAKLSPNPGFPEGIVVNDGKVYVTGPATADQVDHESNILVYHETTGTLKTTIEVKGEIITKKHAIGCSAVDGNGRLYVVTAQPDPSVPPEARLGVVRFRRHANTYVQTSYAGPFPALPPGPGFLGLPLLNDIAFADDGNAYVTDSFQQTIWRIPPGGGSPEVWLRDAKLAGGGPLPIGVNGIRLDPTRQYMYFSVTSTAADFMTGIIYRIPFVENPQASEIEVFHTYDSFAAPDGFAFGKSGKLYVALAGANAISVLDASGTEIKRITSGTSTTGDTIPLDGPASIAFHNPSRSLLITNHSPIDRNPDHFAVLKLYVDDVEDPLPKPHIP